jgi:hypothetical protein
VVSLCGGEKYDDKLPKTAEIHRRYHTAWDAASKVAKAEAATRPIDDAAWEDELRRRSEVEAWLACGGMRMHHPR